MISTNRYYFSWVTRHVTRYRVRVNFALLKFSNASFVSDFIRIIFIRNRARTGLAHIFPQFTRLCWILFMQLKIPVPPEFITIFLTFSPTQSPQCVNVILLRCLSIIVWLMLIYNGFCARDGKESSFIGFGSVRDLWLSWFGSGSGSTRKC